MIRIVSERKNNGTTKNDDACVPARSGIVLKSEKYRRYDIFHSGCLCRETAQTSCDPIGENAFAYFSSGAALVGGMVGKSEKISC